MRKVLVKQLHSPVRTTRAQSCRQWCAQRKTLYTNVPGMFSLEPTSKRARDLSRSLRRYCTTSSPRPRQDGESTGSPTLSMKPMWTLEVATLLPRRGCRLRDPNIHSHSQRVEGLAKAEDRARSMEHARTLKMCPQTPATWTRYFLW
jgi:hypothetical protein